ncbi:aminopeptidase [Crocinitomicaceae bacterium CZZ-1]|uniref:Aminopeptidase n=1 Tax=Taishania pollutisoli TaxID=2766479 RepID=A0A8J6P7T6_9FLAO|nr:aminopeptidase [Taishania pollutisoli]MBC9811551.1 aminopeptidase [Taishania pollutisoli]
MELLKKLTEIRGAASDEGAIAAFIIDYVKSNSGSWKTQPQIISGPGFQDCVILVFGTPRTAVYAHIDTIGFSVGYDKELIKVGGPRLIDGIQLVGSDSQGEIETELMVIENEDGSKDLQYVFDREIDRGTLLTFKPDFRETDTYIQSPYMDNRLGVWNALKVAETLEAGAIVFSTYEEHGGNSVGFCAKYLLDHYQVRQALISDITWVTPGVPHGKGVAISMRDSLLPRRSYLNRIIDLATSSGIAFQLEVESAGGSDGGVLQKSDLPIDWCFIGAPEDHVHTPDELVYKYDIMCMVELYRFLLKNL